MDEWEYVHTPRHREPHRMGNCRISAWRSHKYEGRPEYFRGHHRGPDQWFHDEVLRGSPRSRLPRQSANNQDAQAVMLRGQFEKQLLEENRLRAESTLEPRDLNFADISQLRILSAARVYGVPQAEAAYVKMPRRRKDKEQGRLAAYRGLPGARGGGAGRGSGNGP